jgi:hypothetical protein
MMHVTLRCLNREHYILWAEHTLYRGERFPACAQIADLVGNTRPRHASLNSFHLPRRNITEFLFRDGDRRRSRLHAYASGDALFRGRAGRGFGFELGVDARPHGVDLIRARAGMGGRSRCSDCHCSENQNSHRDHDSRHEYIAAGAHDCAPAAFAAAFAIRLLPFVAL